MVGALTVLTDPVPLLEEHHDPWHGFQKRLVPVSTQRLQVLTPVWWEPAALIIGAFLFLCRPTDLAFDVRVARHNKGPRLLVGT